VPVSVTTSTALAGAIASMKVGGKEYIASGGHGSAPGAGLGVPPVGRLPAGPRAVLARALALLAQHHGPGGGYYYTMTREPQAYNCFFVS
jgi:hypothetical protein